MSRLFRFLFLSAIFTQAFTLEADPNDHTWTHIPLDEVPEGAPAGWQGFDINSIADMAQDGSLLLVGQPESLWLWTRESGYRSLINNESIPGLSGYQLTGIDARWGEDGSYVFWGSAIDPDGLASDTVHHFFGIGDPAGSAAIINQSAPGATEYSAFSAMQVNTLGDRLFTKQEPGVMPQLVFQKSGGGEVVLAQEGEAPVVDPRNDAGKNPVIRSFTETLGWSDYLFLELEIEDTDGVYRAWYLINTLSEPFSWTFVAAEGLALPWEETNPPMLNLSNNNVLTYPYSGNIQAYVETDQGNFVYRGTSPVAMTRVLQDDLRIDTSAGSRFISGADSNRHDHYAGDFEVMLHISADSEQGIWKWAEGKLLERIVEEGMEAPGQTGYVFTSIQDQFMNDDGLVVMYLRADQGANRVYWPWVATGSKDLTLLAGNLETISTVDGGAFLTTQDTRISAELVHPGSSLVLVGAFISGYTNRQYFLVDPNPVVMDPDNTFYWTGKAGDSNWHLEQGQLTNWEDGNDQTALPPGNASSTEFERVVIDNADVELTDQAVTLTVINSTGSLDVRNDLELLERSDVENLKLQGGKVGIAETLKVNNGSWHFGQIQGPGKLIIPDNTLFSIRPTGVEELVLEAETDLAGTLEVFGKTLVVSEPINAKSYDLSLSGFGTLEFGNPLASGNERLKLLEDSVFTNLLRSPGRLVFNGISLSIPEDCIFNNEGVLQVLGAPLILNLGELVNRGELRIDRPVTAVLGILANYGSVIISGSEASGDYGMFFEMMPEQADAVIPELKLEQGAEVNFLNSTVIRNSPFGGMLRNMIITLDGAGSMLDFQGQGYIFNNDGEIILNNAVFKNLPFSLNTDVYSPPDVPNNSFLNQGILEIKAGFYAFQYDFENAGSLMVATGAGFESKGTFVTDENVFVEIDGQLKANEVSLLEDAYIDGTGEITANLLLFPGRIENQFADTLTLNVDMDLSDRANYDIFLDSLGFKSLDINGNINLDTQLVFHADAETVKPLIGQAIPLFRANSITGQLDSGASAGLPGWAAAEPQTLDEVVEAILKKDDSPTYSIWKSRRFNGSQIADEAYSGQTANPDNDSLINLLEFLLGGSPTGPERPDSMIESYLRELPGSDLEFEMRFPWMDRPGGSFTMEKSSDIEVWEEINIQVSDWEEGPFAGKSVKFLHGADQNAAYRVRFSFEEN